MTYLTFRREFLASYVNRVGITLQSLDSHGIIPRMSQAFRANRIVVELDDVLLAALNNAARERSAGIRRPSRSEVLRELILEHLVTEGDARKAGAA